MANYKKSFNFRNGVQVDEDNFLVNANGLVGIGTSVPTETLDVIGTVRVVGFVTTNNATISKLSVTELATLKTVNIGIVSVTSGIITALSGIVTYYGDGSGLVNIPTSQWIDVNTVGTGFSSIYAAGTVGIATTMPYYFLQVGNNPDTSKGIGINSTGDVKTTGIVTASSFNGSGIGITQINASNIESGTLSNSRLPSNISVSGVVTATTFVGGFTGNLTGTAQSASSLTGTPNINVGVITASRIITDTIDVISSPSGITTVASTLNVGVGGTGFTALSIGRIGVGTAVPTSEFQIRKSISTLLEVVSDQNSARISIGQSVGVGKSTAVLRFGSTSKTFDILNNDTGNINMYLHSGPAGIGTGRFAWLYGQNNNELASLTYTGNFGIGITNPTSNLHVLGTCNVTGNTNFGGNVDITGNLTVGSLALPSVLSNTNLNTSTGVSTVANLLISPTGIGSIGINTTSPIAGLDARTANGLFARVGVNTSNFYSNEVLNVYGTGLFLGVGIGTTSLFIDSDGTFGQAQVHNSSLRLYGSNLIIAKDSAVGFNTSTPRSIVDFGRVGTATTNPYVILPNVSTASIAGLGNTVEGAIVYNSTTKKHQGYGSTDGGLTFKWIDLY
jgi:hypothetical protein